MSPPLFFFTQTRTFTPGVIDKQRCYLLLPRFRLAVFVASCLCADGIHFDGLAPFQIFQNSKTDESMMKMWDVFVFMEQMMNTHHPSRPALPTLPRFEFTYSISHVINSRIHIHTHTDNHLYKPFSFL